MLEQLRRNSRSWLIWFIFAILIAAFVLFFGPQSGPEMFGCAGSATQVAEVDGAKVQAHSWRFAMNSLGGTSGSSNAAAQRRAVAIDKLVEREILAAEAERMGMKVSDDLVREKIKVGEIYLLGQQVDGKRIYFKDSAFFDYKFLELWVNNSGLSSVDSFIGEQKREILANLARDVLMSSARTSLEEARSTYIDNNTRVSLEYLTFPVTKYAAALKLSEADAERFANRHEDKLKEAWETEKAQFSTDKERVLARVIVINRDNAAAPSGDQPAPEADAAKAKADATHARATAGEDFAALATELSDEARSKRRGGLTGWRSADSLGYGKAVVDAVKDLEPGQVSAVVEGPRGYTIVKVEQRASTALTYDQRKADIAYRMASDYYAEKLALRDANTALAKVETGKALADVFERKPTPPPSLNPGAGGAGQLTPDQLKKLQEQLEKSLKEQQNNAPTEGATEDSGKQGWILREGDVVLAQAGATTEAAAAPSAEPAPADEVLPEVDLGAPLLEKLGPLSRPGDKLAGIGRSKQLIRDLFENLKEGEVASKVYTVSEPDGVVVVQLLERTEADLEKFAKEADASREQMALAEGVAIVHAFVDRRCRGLAESGDIGVNKAYLKYDDEKPALAYTACASLSQRDVLMQLASRYPSLQALLYGLM